MIGINFSLIKVNRFSRIRYHFLYTRQVRLFDMNFLIFIGEPLFCES
jgi:hypothetical protein